jgi:hypothetical protein
LQLALHVFWKLVFPVKHAILEDVKTVL